MSDYTVVYTFNSGSGEYTFPLAQKISDPEPTAKATIIEGIRGDGSVYIPGGKKSHTITLTGLLFDNDGFKDITTLMDNMRTAVNTNSATLTCKYWDPEASGGGAWVTVWAYTVRRTSEIDFGDSQRTAIQPYTVSFLVLSY